MLARKAMATAQQRRRQLTAKWLKYDAAGRPKWQAFSRKQRAILSEITKEGLALHDQILQGTEP